MYTPAREKPSACSEIWTVTDLRMIEYNGGYLEDCNVVRALKPWAADPEAAARLWTMSEEMVGEKFDL